MNHEDQTNDHMVDDIAQLQHDIQRIKGTSCPSFTADPDHPGDALYCSHTGGDGHGGLHRADIDGRTWGWADPTDTAATEVRHITDSIGRVLRTDRVPLTPETDA